MTIGGERAAVQNPFLCYAVEAGWTYLPPEEALRLRRGQDGLTLHEIAVAQLQALNPGVLDHNRAEEVLARLARVPPTIEGNLQVWEHLKGVRTVFVPEENRERNILLLDPEKPERNTFHITDELIFTNGRHRIRADIVLFINGLPVLIVETKAAHRVEGIAEALDQIRRYHREGPELMALLQIQALTHLVHFYYGPTWNPSRKTLFNRKDEAAGDYETLSRLYRVLRSAYEPGVSIDRDFARKTARLVQEHTRSSPLREPEGIYEIRKDTLDALAASDEPDTVKVFNLLKALRNIVTDDLADNPYLISIGERAEAIVLLFQERQLTTQETLRQLEDLVRELRQAQQERAEKDMPGEAFAVYWLLTWEGVEQAEQVGEAMAEAFARHPHWKISERHAREVRRELWRALIGAVPDEDIASLVDRVLKIIAGAER